MDKTSQAAKLVVALLVIGGAIWYIEAGKPQRLSPSDAPDVVVARDEATTTDATSSGATATAGTPAAPKPTPKLTLAEKAAEYSKAKELADPTGFVNAQPFKLSDIAGKKVILIDFWTYSCINCQRTLPYIEAWYDKYKDQGLEIVGVHTPEFDFEKDLQNVTDATKRLGVKYPVVLDSNRGTWNAYAERFWPSQYLVDIDGFVVKHDVGEGGYAEMERAIQAALDERATALGVKVSFDRSLVNPNMPKVQTSSPETYFGAARNELLGNGQPGREGEQNLLAPGLPEIVRNQLYLGGRWNFAAEYAESLATSSPSSVFFRYASKGVYLVAGSASGKGIDIEVKRDGSPVDAAVKGADIFYRDGKSYVTVSGNRLYRLLEDAAFGEHTIELVVPPGVQLYTFTFG